jgi:hypothetical protein
MHNDVVEIISDELSVLAVTLLARVHATSNEILFLEFCF